MGNWDEEAGSDVGYKVQYYCKVCEQFFLLSPIAPLRCPMCFCDPRYIIGPMMTREYDIEELVRKHNRKYNKVSRR
jgi:hypothetical protein